MIWWPWLIAAFLAGAAGGFLLAVFVGIEVTLKIADSRDQGTYPWRR